MIRLLATILFLLLAMQTAFSAAPEKPVVNQEKQAVNGKDQSDRQEPAIWPVPFHPSQEIGADSQVSFPEDI